MFGLNYASDRGSDIIWENAILGVLVLALIVSLWKVISGNRPGIIREETT